MHMLNHHYPLSIVHMCLWSLPCRLLAFNCFSATDEADA